MHREDLEALKAALRGLKTTAARLQQVESAVDRATDADPPADLIRAATAHAIAASALAGLLHRVFTPGGARAGDAAELTDSSGESAT